MDKFEKRGKKLKHDEVTLQMEEVTNLLWTSCNSVSSMNHVIHFIYYVHDYIMVGQKVLGVTLKMSILVDL